jgi:hypothetical protein
MRTTIGRTAIALAVSAVSVVGLAGTALAAEPSPAAVAAQFGPYRPPPPPPHRFRARFRSQQECIARARHDHNRDTTAWDCRRGRDPRGPWEYWGR